MIRPIVVFKVREDVSRDDPRVERAFAAPRALPGKIEGIQPWVVGENFSGRSIAFDYGLFSPLSTRLDPFLYITPPAHRAAGGLL